MIRYLIKNNLKLMLRNKWVLGIMILGPILVIAILSSAFQDLMKSYEGVDEFHAGYRLESDGIQDSIEQIKEAGIEAGITLEEYPEGDIKSLMENNGLAGFVEFEEDTYTVYKSEDFTVEGLTLEYFCSQVMKEAANQALGQMIPTMQEEEVELPIKQLDYMPAIDSKDYYGMVYIVYFIWCGIVCAVNVLSSEQKNGIDRKYQVSSISNFKLFLGKWIPSVLTITVETAIAVVATILLLDIHWGNPFLSALLILFTAMASAAFGLLLYYVSRNLAVTIIILFTTTWFMGFFGGSFETYMFSNWSDTIKNATPIYHVNRALVEYSCMGQSTYTNSSIMYMLGITVVCAVAAVIVDGMRKRG